MRVEGTHILRVVLLALALLGLAPSAWAVSAPVLRVDPHIGRLNLTLHMAAMRVADGQDVEPDTLWRGDAGEPLEAAERWRTQTGSRLVGRIVLQGGERPGNYIVHVPAGWIDEVQLWYREAGGSWHGAMAGDRVPLSRWPFAAQNPAFDIAVGSRPVDLLLVVDNPANARIPVWLMPDALYREAAIRQSNLSGMNMGLGLMVVVFTVLGAAVYRRRAHVLLAAVSGWVLLTVVCLNGNMALWFTPESPGFNDGNKQFTGVMMSALMLTLTAEALDQRYLSRLEHALKWAVPVAVLLYAVVQVVWLPTTWRLPGAGLVTLATLAASAAMCGMSAMRGGRYVRWIMAALGCYAVAVLTVYLPLDYIGGLDVRAATVAFMLFASMLAFYQALFLRERYGRDVLGRAAIAANRDPLTALLSLQGFQQAYDQALLRQGAVGGKTPVMLFMLPGLEQSGMDHGFVLTERVVVHFAAILQAVLGDTWSIGRLNKTRFACIGVGGAQQLDMQALATQVLAHCARATGGQSPMNGFDLRITCAQREIGLGGMSALLRELEDAAAAIIPPKRIALVSEPRSSRNSRS